MSTDCELGGDTACSLEVEMDAVINWFVVSDVFMLPLKMFTEDTDDGDNSGDLVKSRMCAMAHIGVEGNVISPMLLNVPG